MKQTEWKIVCSDYAGADKRAADFLSEEIGRYLIREEGVYRLHVLPCEKEGCAIEHSAVVVGLYSESATIRKYVKEEELNGRDYFVKIADNPDREGGSLVLITAHTSENLFYAAVWFADDYIPARAPEFGAVRMPQNIFDKPLKPAAYGESARFRTRSVFTWGHPLNDYRGYIDDLARLKFNRLILWNDYMPVNIGEVIDYAHARGIEVFCGYAWGWSCSPITDIGDKRLAAWRKEILREYEENYAKTACDGIYFQSFTERSEEDIGGRSIAATVADFVNETAGALLEKHPDVKLQFGLHAMSVKNRLEEIARVDRRVAILWEDCGEFPYSYWPKADEKKFEEALAFTKKILSLRGDAPVGLVFKGNMTLDWTKFVNQRGPFVLGKNAAEIAEHDARLRRGAWRAFSAGWMRYGGYAARMLKYIEENAAGDVEMCLAGTFDGGVRLPQALCAQMFYAKGEDFGETLEKTARRSYVTLD